MVPAVLNTWKLYCSATGVADGYCRPTALAVSTTTADVSFWLLIGDSAPGVPDFSVDPSAAALAPVAAGATGAAGFAVLQAYRPPASAHTENEARILVFIHGSKKRTRAKREWVGANC